MIGSIHQEAIIILNIYATNNRAPKYMKQKWRNEERNRQFINNKRGLQYAIFHNG